MEPWFLFISTQSENDLDWTETGQLERQFQCISLQEGMQGLKATYSLQIKSSYFETYKKLAIIHSIYQQGT